MPSEPLRHHHDERQHREGDERQPPVHDDEDDHDAEQREHVAEDRHDAGGEEIVQNVHVGRHAGHQAPDRIAIEESHVEPLKVLVDLGAQVEHDALPRHLEHPGLEVFERERSDEDAEEDQRNPVQPLQIARRDVAIDGELHDVGLRQLKDRRRDDRRERNRDVHGVRPQVAQQPAHQPGIVGFAEDLFFVDGHYLLPRGPTPAATRRSASLGLVSCDSHLSARLV